MPRIRPIILIGTLISLFLLACGGDEDTGSDGGRSVELTAPAGAATTGFEPTTLQVEAGASFRIHFVNDDTGVPHNVQIFEGDTATDQPVWAPEADAVITGPGEVDYDVPGLTAGTYTFNCLTHPTTMVGTLTVG
jgi:plastocyanin